MCGPHGFGGSSGIWNPHTHTDTWRRLVKWSSGAHRVRVEGCLLVEQHLTSLYIYMVHHPRQKIAFSITAKKFNREQGQNYWTSSNKHDSKDNNSRPLFQTLTLTKLEQRPSDDADSWHEIEITKSSHWIPERKKIMLHNPWHHTPHCIISELESLRLRI